MVGVDKQAQGRGWESHECQQQAELQVPQLSEAEGRREKGWEETRDSIEVSPDTGHRALLHCLTSNIVPRTTCECYCQLF